jgi:hypothetical protein
MPATAFSQTPYRLAGLLLAVAVAATAIYRWRAPEAMQSVNLEPPASIGALEQAVRDDAISPYRWLELAEGYEDAGYVGKARQSLQRAEELAPNLPPVWIRAAGFHFRRGEREKALAAGARAQAIAADADEFLFQSYDRFVRDTPMVIRALTADRRSLIAWFHHLINGSKPDDAARVWTELVRQSAANRELAIPYIRFLLAQHRYQAAESVWIAQTTPSDRGRYPDDRIFNGGFEAPPTECPLDWKITPLEGVEMERDPAGAHDGKFALRIHFPGTANIDFQNVAQYVIVTPGQYRFSAWLRTEGITTDQGVHLTLADAESPTRFKMDTESLRGDNGWKEISGALVVPAQTNLLSVAIRREPSGKFDNKIAGTVWVDSVSLTRER